MDRRDVLKGAMTGVLTLWASPLLRAAQQQAGVRRLSDKLAVLDGGGTNIVVLSGSDGLLLVDSGVAGAGERILSALKGMPGGNTRVTTVINTHYHLDQTGNNELFANAGAKAPSAALSPRN